MLIKLSNQPLYNHSTNSNLQSGPMIRKTILPSQRLYHQKLIKSFSSAKDLQEALKVYYKKNDPLPGFCDQQGTKTFSKRSNQIDPSYWKHPYYIKEHLSVSSMGLGTQNGSPTQQSDLKMFKVIVEGIRSGKCNFLDTDINFRFGKSQKTINAALNYLNKEEQIGRNQIFISTKCGYIPNDVDSSLDDKAFKQILLDQKYVQPEDIINDIYCIHPDFLKFSLEKSLLSLGLQTLDLMYLNNPAQSLLPVVGNGQFEKKMEKAFETLQEFRELGKIKYYGVASFVSFRSPPHEEGIHSSLNNIVEIAKRVGGENHGLRYILIPFNIGMPEALMNWQLDANGKQKNIFQICKENQVNINLCCPLFQGRLSKVPFQSQLLNYLNTNSAKHLQLVRSLPKPNILSTIFSTEDVVHLEQNLQLVKHPLLTAEQWKKILPIDK